MKIHHATGAHGFPALTVDPQRRTWVEGGRAGRWTCSTCGKSTTSLDVDGVVAFVQAHGHTEVTS